MLRAKASYLFMGIPHMTLGKEYEVVFDNTRADTVDAYNDAGVWQTYPSADFAMSSATIIPSLTISSYFDLGLVEVSREYKFSIRWIYENSKEFSDKLLTITKEFPSASFDRSFKDFLIITCKIA